jgi:lincosamide and streptogramin A transport system ATP-binding/permease protein
MSTIRVNNLTFAYGGDPIFEDVSFHIDTSWKLGFVGRNGRGKTTFLKLLLGEYAYSGNITASVHFDYFPFSVADPAQNTLDLIYGINSDFEHWELERELSLLSVDSEVLYRPYHTLSNGEQTKILLAALFLKPANFLLLDEPTNHLDHRARMQVCDYLDRKSGFILVSHDRDFLDRCTDHTISINKMNIDVQAGNFSQWWANKEFQDSFELAENEKLKKDIKRLNQAAQRTTKWADKVEKSKHVKPASGNSVDTGYVGHKSAKMMKRAKGLESRQNAAAQRKSGLLKNIETAEDLSIHPLDYHKNPLIRTEQFEINKGERILMKGKNGCGKTTFIKKIIAENKGLIISYIPQDTGFLKGGLKDFVTANGLDESLFFTILRKLDFERALFDKEIATFSDGQKKKVLIARSLCEQAHLYIWDEPLNFIDIYSRMQLENLILKYAPTMLLIEHDVTFENNVATKVIEMAGNVAHDAMPRQDTP